MSAVVRGGCKLHPSAGREGNGAATPARSDSSPGAAAGGGGRQGTPGGMGGQFHHVAGGCCHGLCVPVGLASPSICAERGGTGVAFALEWGRGWPCATVSGWEAAGSSASYGGGAAPLAATVSGDSGEKGGCGGWGWYLGGTSSAFCSGKGLLHHVTGSGGGGGRGGGKGRARTAASVVCGNGTKGGGAASYMMTFGSRAVVSDGVGGADGATLPHAVADMGADGAAESSGVGGSGGGVTLCGMT